MVNGGISMRVSSKWIDDNGTLIEPRRPLRALHCLHSRARSNIRKDVLNVFSVFFARNCTTGVSRLAQLAGTRFRPWWHDMRIPLTSRAGNQSRSSTSLVGFWNFAREINLIVRAAILSSYGKDFWISNRHLDSQYFPWSSPSIFT